MKIGKFISDGLNARYGCAAFRPSMSLKEANRIARRDYSGWYWVAFFNGSLGISEKE